MLSGYAYLALVFGRASWRAVLPHAAGLASAAAVFAALTLLRLRRQL